MALSEFEKSKFWDLKIQQWDSDRYDRKAFKTNAILNRVQLAVELMSPNLKGARVLELGCGAGRSIEYLKNCGIKSYLGIDFSNKAVELAQARAVSLNMSSLFKFKVQDVDDSGLDSYDIVFSLGLFDWIQKEKIIELLKKHKNIKNFHSFSRKNNSISQIAHRLYVYALYGYKTKNYVPFYHSDSEIKSYFDLANISNASIVQPEGMSFGAFIHNLDY